MSEQLPFSGESDGELYAFVEKQLRYGVKPTLVHDQLREKGVSQPDAANMVSTVLRARTEANQRSGKRNMMFGALWFGGGALISAISYFVAKDGGGYLVTWGAMIFGGLQLLNGMMQYHTK